MVSVRDAANLLPQHSRRHKELKINFHFLRTFLVYIPRLVPKDTDLSKHLGITVRQIRDAFEDNPLPEIDDDDEFEDSPFTSAIKDIMSGGEEGDNSLNSLLEKFELLNPKILQVYDYLISYYRNKVVFRQIHVGFGLWIKFVDWICKNIQDLIQNKHLNSSLFFHFQILLGKLHNIHSFIKNCYSVDDDDDKLEEFRGPLASVAVSAARFSFLCWVDKDGIHNNVMVKMAFDLRQMIFEVYFSIVTSPERRMPDDVNYLAENFMGFLLPSHKNVVLKCYREGLEMLVRFLIHTSEERERKDVELISADIKCVLLEAEFVKYFIHEPDDYPVRLLFPEKVELLKAQVFVVMEFLLRTDFTPSAVLCDAYDKIPFQSLRKGVESLKTFRRCQKHQDQTGMARQILMNFEMLVVDLESIRAKSREKYSDNKFKLLLGVKLLKAEIFLLDILLNEDQNLIRNLNQGLQVLREFLSPANEEKFVHGRRILSRVAEVVRKVSSLHNSLVNHFSQEKQDRPPVMERNDSLSMLLEEIEHIGAEIQDPSGQVIPRSSKFSFPETNGPGFVDYFLENLKRFQGREDPDPTHYLENQILFVLEEMESLRSFVNDDAATTYETNIMRLRIVDLAYQADYIIDTIMLGNCWLSYHVAWLYDVKKGLRSSKSPITEFGDNKCGNEFIETVPETIPKPRPAAMSYSQENEVILDRPDEEEFVKGKLRRPTKSREIVSIVGMGGIGKSTLAKKVYGDPNVAAEYEIRAWGHVSRVYEKRQLLLDIFKSVIQKADHFEDKSYEHIALLLKQNLSRKKYLIVLDDLWDTEAWNDLVLSFPEDENGSTILLTCREREVASKIKGSHDHFELPPFNKVQSWSLLEKMVFRGKEDYPLELLEPGNRIVRGCNGLPLAIVVVAGLLKGEGVDRWNEIAKDVSNAAAANMDILEVSYKQLPDRLKPCFLYLGAFQWDKEILASKLLKLWVAEGFIRNNDPDILPERVAEGYLNDLVARNLVIPSQQTSRGGVKTCRVHSILCQLCRSRAEKEHFFQQIIGYDEHFGTSYDQFKYGDIPYYNGPSNLIKYEQHRLIIYSRRNHFALLKPSGSPVRSLLLFGTDEEHPGCSYDMSFISDNFRLLKVLDMESMNMGSSFPAGIETLERLRYLAVSGDIKCIPKSIAYLCNLETFFVNGLRGIVHIPKVIWEIQGLKHFHVSDTATFSSPEEEHKDRSNLVSFSTPYLSCGADSEKLTKMLSRLKKLRCKFSKSQGHSKKCNRTPVISFLTLLESLNLSYYDGNTPSSCEFWFPSTLKKLSLSNLKLPTSYISRIASLHELKVLKLLSVAFDEERWEMEDEFPKLEYLKIDNSGLVYWIADDDDDGDYFPKLRKLVLKSCSKLKGLPENFSEIDSLKMIELQWCDQSVGDSALKIQQEKLDANQPFKLSIDGQYVVVVKALDD